MKEALILIKEGGRVDGNLETSAAMKNQSVDLTTDYLGLRLRSPLVVSASTLSRDIESIQEMEQSGAAAVVLQSLFAEHVEAGQTVTQYPHQMSPEGYLEHVAWAKESVRIPIIASLNCSKSGEWTTMARRIEEAGADALELNIYRVVTDVQLSGSLLEEEFVEIVRAVRGALKIPLAVKLSPYFSNFAHMARRLDEAGADALVLFNRFYQPDIDLNKMEIAPHLMLSTPTEMRLPLRWIGILFGKLHRADLAATGGIHGSSDAIKMLLVGAKVTMLCTVLMRYGIGYIAKMEKEIARWMEEKHYSSVADFAGILSQKKCPDPEAFERDQYIYGLTTYEPLFLMRHKRTVHE